MIRAMQLQRHLRWSTWEEAIECGDMTLEEIDAVVAGGYHREKPSAQHCDDLVEGIVFNYPDQTLANATLVG